MLMLIIMIMSVCRNIAVWTIFACNLVDDESRLRARGGLLNTFRAQETTTGGVSVMVDFIPQIFYQGGGEWEG